MPSGRSFLRVAAAFVVLPLAVAHAPAQQETLKIRLARAPGSGPFRPALHISAPGENGGSWEAANRDVRGIPADLHAFSLRYLNMQIDQYVYQALCAGRIDSTLGRETLARLDADTARLTHDHVDQDIPIVTGIDREGNTVYVVDTKPDHSFWGKDRIVIPPFDADALTDAQMDSMNGIIDRPEVTYEYYDGNRVREGDVVLRLLPYLRIPPAARETLRGKIVFGVSTWEYRRGLFRIGDARYMAAVSNGFLSGVYGGTKNEFAFYPAADSDDIRPATALIYHEGDRVAFGDDTYRIGGITVDGMTLTLVPETGLKPGDGSAVGLRAPGFAGVTAGGDSISLDRYHGKRVLLFFWFPGSVRSDAEIPYVNDVWRALGGASLQVIGLALRVGPSLREFDAVHRVRWPQLVLTDSSRLLRDYAVLGYPALYLIDSAGTVAVNQGLAGGEISRALIRTPADSAAFAGLVDSGNVTFVYPGGDRKRVEVAGDFTNWLPLPLYRSGPAFSRRTTIAPGRYLYRFTVDGGTKLDPSAAETAQGPDGRASSVLTVK